MKVAFFTPTRQRCGIADYSRHLLAHLRGHAEIEVVAAERIASRGSYAELGRSMNDADVAHIQYEHAFFLVDDAAAENFDALIRELRVPAVLTLHCLPLEEPLWQRRLEEPGLFFLVHSRHHERSLRARGTRGAIEVMPLPAPPRSAGAASPAAYRAAHGLDGKAVLAIFGFTKRHKAYELALEALARLPADVVLRIAGGPQDERDQRDLAAVLRRARELAVESRVSVAGYIAEAELGAALGASDVVLAPFTSMTASGSVATALGWERPVVAAALEPLVELRDELGCVQLFEPGTAADLARQIERVLGDAVLRGSLAAGARRYRERFSYAELARRTRALYERAVAGSQPLAREDRWASPSSS